MARYAQIQTDGTYLIYCLECRDLICSAKNERGVYLSAAAPHECPKTEGSGTIPRPSGVTHGVATPF